MSKKSPKRARALRRALERDVAKLAEQKERLFRLEAGGAPEFASEVEAASLVEVVARARSCPRCDGELEVLEHAAVTRGGLRLREARVRCRACGSARSIWFRIAPRQLN